MGAVTLNYEDKHSALWLKLKQHIADELDVLRKRNDGLMDAEKTSYLRGMIAAMKKLDALDAEVPVIEE